MAAAPVATNSSGAVVVLSGGADSTICLAWALPRFASVQAVSFDYGQRHRIELDAARRVAGLAGIEHRIIPCESMRALGGNALTGDVPVADSGNGPGGLPNTFVPGRNLIFLTLAAAYGWPRGLHHLVAGVCQTDYSGYPDCRESTMHALQAALRAGMDAPFTIHTPLMHLNKAQSVGLMRGLGKLDWLAHTHTCYNGSVPPCGHCPACVLRTKGFAEAGITDPLLARLGR